MIHQRNDEPLTHRQILLGDALCRMLIAAGVYGPGAEATGPELLAAADDYLRSVADDGEPVTVEWLHGLPGRVIDPSSRDTVLIELGDDRYLVVELEDFSLALQEGSRFDDRNSNYFALPRATARVRGDIRRLLLTLRDLIPTGEPAPLPDLAPVLGGEG